MLFVISIVPFLSDVTIAFLYVSEFLMAIISGEDLSRCQDCCVSFIDRL